MTSEAVDSAVARWKEAAARIVWLPSGTWLKYRAPNALTMVTRGLIDPELRELAVAFSTTGVDTAKLSPEQLVQFNALRHRTVAEMVLAVAWGDEDPERFGHPVGEPDCWQTITADSVVDHLDDFGSDLSLMIALADRRITPEAVTLQTRALRRAINAGLIDQVLADRAREAEAEVRQEEATIEDVRRFRSEQRGGNGDGDGDPVQVDAEPAARA